MSESMRRANGSAIVASCNGHEATGGGLLAVTDDGAERLDDLSSSGLCVIDDRLYRLLHGNAYAGGAAELLVYDRDGVSKYLRLDRAGEAHDVFPTADGFGVVSALENGIIFFGADGEVRARWTAPGGPDSWHLNCVEAHQDQLYATAFGRFDRYREWRHEGDETGMLFELESGEPVVEGLTYPHNPRHIDDHWFVCNSGRCELVVFDDRGRRVDAVRLPGWTRGFAADDDHFFVGVSSARRMPTDTGTGAIHVIDRSTLQPVDELPIPYSEIYNLVVVPADLVEGVRRGFRTNPQRTHESDQHDLFRRVGVQPHRIWLTGLPIADDARRVRFEGVRVSSACRPNELIRLDGSLTNEGSDFLTSVPPHPVYVVARWRDRDGNEIADAEPIHTRLPAPVAPGETVSFRCTAVTPVREGHYELTLTLVQEGCGSFDRDRPENAATISVDVLER